MIWEQEVEDLPIVRSIERNSVTKKPWLSRSFQRVFKKNIARAGSRETSLAQTTVHAIRRALAAEVDSKFNSTIIPPKLIRSSQELYTEAQRSQHIGQSDPRVYGAQYVANCSAADGKSAFHKETPQTKSIDYFQSFAQWYQPGLPTSLPSEQEEELRRIPELLTMFQHYQKLKACPASSVEADAAYQKYYTALNRCRRETLQEYQRIWAEQQNLKQIYNPTNESRAQKPKQEILRALSHIFPERTRLAYALTSTAPVNLDQRKNIIDDILTAITRDHKVVYLPKETPIDGRCVDLTCLEDIYR